MAGAKKRVIFLKLSGERLAKKSLGWDIDSLNSLCKKLKAVYDLSQEAGITGIALVPGAGNIIRGDELKKKNIAAGREDMLGRLGIIMNGLVVETHLKQVGLPIEMFIAPSMNFEDARSGQPVFKSKTYSAKGLNQAFNAGRVGIISGGAGVDNATTDYAVSFYAGDYHKNYPSAEVIVLKGTKWDGVYERDPGKVKNVRRYRIIGAPMMQREYGRFSAVDRRSLQEIIDKKLEMLVYADELHNLATVIRRDLVSTAESTSIGTLIVSGDIEPVFY
jgi:uridylate kinase